MLLSAQFSVHYVKPSFVWALLDTANASSMKEIRSIQPLDYIFVLFILVFPSHYCANTMTTYGMHESKSLQESE
ncbi:hypothetical protein QE152_g27426 [Popillia japonica]|uniref:Uncharacterized protein n=1 Tax=Popillia japonica TaxID=7064 RepID=A0AAW1JUF3_POPJA